MSVNVIESLLFAFNETPATLAIPETSLVESHKVVASIRKAISEVSIALNIIPVAMDEVDDALSLNEGVAGEPVVCQLDQLSFLGHSDVQRIHLWEAE
jgi:hypothetical protein